MFLFRDVPKRFVLMCVPALPATVTSSMRSERCITHMLHHTCIHNTQNTHTRRVPSRSLFHASVCWGRSSVATHTNAPMNIPAHVNPDHHLHSYTFKHSKLLTSTLTCIFTGEPRLTGLMAELRYSQNMSGLVVSRHTQTRYGHEQAHTHTHARIHAHTHTHTHILTQTRTHTLAHAPRL